MGKAGYYDEYYSNSPGKNPVCTLKGFLKVMRGGSYFQKDVHCRSTYRAQEKPDSHGYYTGFRIVRRP